MPQVVPLQEMGYAVYSLCIPPSDRSSWEELTLCSRSLLQQVALRHTHQGRVQKVTLVAESFGACLAMRIALQMPEMLEQVVVINSATAFPRALFGLPGLVASTNLLGLFPAPLYDMAQSVILPLLVDARRVPRTSSSTLRALMEMKAPPSSSLERNSGNGSNGSNGSNGAGSNGSGRLATPQQQEQGIDPVGEVAKALGLYHLPAVAANHRLQLLQQGDLGDERLAHISVPMLVVASQQDRLFPSLSESSRLIRVLPNARRAVLRASGHSPLLERGVSLPDLLKQAAFHLPNPVLAEQPLPQAKRPQPIASPLQPGSAVPAGAPAATPAAAEAAETAMPAKTIVAAPEAPVPQAAAAIPIGASTQMDNGKLAEQSIPEREREGMASIVAKDMAWDEVVDQMELWKSVLSPCLLGTERLPDPQQLNGQPVLFVGNHTLFGLYDMPVLLNELYLHGFKPRGLAHPAHWQGPVGPFFERFGAVKASPLAAYRLLREGSCILLFPGGGREVVKRKGEQYQLMWKEKADFVRLANRCGAIIVPFSAVGGDDAYKLAMDTDEILGNPVLGPLARGVLRGIEGLDPGEAVFPITTLPGTDLPSPFPLPDLQRLYFSFGTPVDLKARRVNEREPREFQAVYEEIKGQVEDGIQYLRRYRSLDSNRYVGGRIRSAAVSFLDAYR